MSNYQQRLGDLEFNYRHLEELVETIVNDDYIDRNFSEHKSRLDELEFKFEDHRILYEANSSKFLYLFQELESQEIYLNELEIQNEELKDRLSRMERRLDRVYKSSKKLSKKH